MHPNEGAANTVDLAVAMATLAGAPVAASGAKASLLTRAIGEHDHYVFALADGLGMNLVETLAEDAFLRAHTTMELRAVCPSSTAPALTSIATARWPAEHGVTGWWTYLPEAGVSATILPYIERFTEQPLDQTKAPPSLTFPVAACARSFTCDYAMYLPAPIAGSVYSRYSAGERANVPYRKLWQAVDAIAERIERAGRPTYTYLYAPFVDTAEHTYGPSSSQAALALASVQARIEHMAERLRGRARIVVTADHGQMRVGRRHVLKRDDPLVAMLVVPPTGDGRGPLFHVRDGEHERFAPAFRERFGEDFALLTIDEASAMGLFGPVALSDVSRRRFGDFMGVALSDAVVLYEPSHELATMIGHHGGLSPDEMRVPLVVA
jgi:hypothetical protein